MISKIIAGPHGFYAFCATEPIAAHPSMWDELHDLLGPQRETPDDAQADLELMQQAMSPAAGAE